MFKLQVGAAMRAAKEVLPVQMTVREAFERTALQRSFALGR